MIEDEDLSHIIKILKSRYPDEILILELENEIIRLKDEYQDAIYDSWGDDA